MCGICGFVSQDDEETLARMTAALSRCGPDDLGLHMSAPWDGPGVGSGNGRLAVLDSSPAGQMPMPDPEHALRITYNGEIYTQLRKDLESRCSRSKSESEAILCLYQSEGSDLVRRLNGMFANAIRDERRGQLFLARNYFEPLNCFRQADRFAFRSEGFDWTTGLPQASSARIVDADVH